MLSKSEAVLVAKSASDGLDRAINYWTQIGHLMRAPFAETKCSIRSAVTPAPSLVKSFIPGHPFIEEEHPEVDEFIALVVDMRNSSGRLKGGDVFPQIDSGIQRVYYETSALLPALAQTVLLNNGHVTEYLGDGVLVLFKVDATARESSMNDAYDAAYNCVHDTRAIVNELLYRRFSLPGLDLGAGLSISQALITFVGIAGNRQAKAIGRCVWEASKLSVGVNSIYVSLLFRELWSHAEDRKLMFRKAKAPIDGFLVW
ncbi:MULTISPECIES: hypothetical protein [unclassified Pseudomonas]|uniref:hypothetical protein n=1 Tax=unclassified Pseudomonas TaxID=196821 RepID=UPI000C86E335|nr:MULTISPECIES: hypothetical protein [unclassified Pseudomonas]PMV17977.1 hypothetical protein C1X17_28000 [Pseudomonas sp. FW305-3-2-15-C-TSA2]PMV19319.1 hypothetical protein C1X22_28690 [Pseudomonas sp. DP16D-L5]PMV33410.1 hypothetical protein C1X21_28925 [Pseudomonas sp. FW305-3-2-15-A-LB2]PMV38494.1 hypothetical protein C1X16_29035 [Pseudomonas sp. FW305-3-2-15-C-R2A1]PMV43560.1 hypothetical protein C1X18_28220 [Pseudomonas sp. FW305-3-2-15-C-LB1]